MESKKESIAMIEVTPEMLEAGYRVFSESGVTDDPVESDKLLLSEIYRSMYLLAPVSIVRESSD